VTASAGDLEASDRVALVEYIYVPLIANSDTGEVQPIVPAAGRSGR
jgi:hypothetical protein